MSMVETKKRVRSIAASRREHRLHGRSGPKRRRSPITAIRRWLVDDIGEDGFASWFETATRLTVDAGRLQVGCPDPYVREWVRAQYDRALTCAAREVLGAEADVQYMLDADLCDDPRRAGRLVSIPYEEYLRLTGRAITYERAFVPDSDASYGRKNYIPLAQLGRMIAGKRIVEARKKVGLSQAALGKKVGMPQSQISRIERNPGNCTVKTLRKLAKALKVDVATFLQE